MKTNFTDNNGVETICIHGVKTNITPCFKCRKRLQAHRDAHARLVKQAKQRLKDRD